MFGLSTQTTDYQQEAAERLHLPFELLSDEALTFAGRLSLPTFEVDGMTLIKRLTLIVRDGVIVHVFYPVFPPDRNPDDVAAWLRATQKEASHPMTRRCQDHRRSHPGPLRTCRPRPAPRCPPTARVAQLLAHRTHRRYTAAPVP